MQEVNDVASVISKIVADDANIIFGTSVDEDYGDEIAVTVVATSFDVPEPSAATSTRFAPAPVAPDQEETYGKFRAAPPKEEQGGDRPRKFWSRF